MTGWPAPCIAYAVPNRPLPLDASFLMSVREYTDSHGVEWRAWDVTPAHMHPVTRAEDYMGNLQDGWLVFESGGDKRRLEAPYPGDWTSFDIPALEALCERAAPVVRKRSRSVSGEQRAVTAAEAELDAIRSEDSCRTFQSPGGRTWTVRVHECQDEAGLQRAVLRFTAGDIVVDLPEWPEDWRTASTVDYAMMLLDADPPRRPAKGRSPRRRHADRVE